MKKINWNTVTKRRALGLVLMFLGLVVLFMPIFVGGWVIALLGIVFLGAGLVQIVNLVRSPENDPFLDHVPGVLFILLGLLLFLSPHMALAAIVAVITIALLIDGGVKVYSAFTIAHGTERRWKLFNGLVTIGLGLLIWFFITADLGIIAISIILGTRLLVEGWTMFFLPDKGFVPPDEDPDLRDHPDGKLGLEPSDLVKEMREKLRESEAAEATDNLIFCIKILLVFFVIHLLRTDAQWSFIGFISPFSAIIGDAVMALILAVFLILPIRVLSRKFTRPIEREAWKHLDRVAASGEEPSYVDNATRYWLEHRMRLALRLKYARYSLNHALWWMMRVGLPITAVFIAINSIWGFSWYFNSENWASGVWQEITKGRVDAWRKRGAEEAERYAYRQRYSAR
jgi:uncharacterized membrane protein HdeD (DUF308 family)